MEKRVHKTIPLIRCYSLGNKAKGFLCFILIHNYDVHIPIYKPKKQLKIQYCIRLTAKNTLYFLLLSYCSTYAKEPEVNFLHPIHGYEEIRPIDPFSTIRTKLENGKINSFSKSPNEYLLNLLKELSISIHSQLLVYSTTSLQLSKISPQNPRAIYFSDDIYLGYVPGGQIEVIGIDPKLGAIPYIFNIPKNQDLEHPLIHRSSRCMNCHASKDIGRIPGLLISSVIPGPGGGTLDRFRKNSTGHEIQFKDRFGGWHITGHNPFTNSWANYSGIMKNGQINRVDNLPGTKFKWDKYITNSSNLLAHLLLEHQVGFTNRCIEITYKYRELIHNENSNTKNTSIINFIEEKSNDLLSYILFKNEAKLPQSINFESSTFISDFEKKQGESSSSNGLRKLNLKTRLLENRCSYMVFSNSFLGLPEQFKKILLRKLKLILQNKNGGGHFSYLTAKEKVNILDSLNESMIGFSRI